MQTTTSNFFIAKGFGEVKAFVNDALKDIEPEQVVTFGGIVNHWGSPVTPEYFRTLVSQFGKTDKKIFSVKVLPVTSGEGFAKVKRVR